MQLAAKEKILWPASAIFGWQQRCAEKGQQQGWPTRDTPHWRYERSMPWQRSWAMCEAAQMPSQLPLAYVKEAYPLIFCDGCYQPDFSNLPAGIIVKNALLENLPADMSIWLESFLAQATEEHTYVLWAMAYASCAVRIVVEEGCRIDKPVHIIRYFTSQHRNKQSHTWLHWDIHEGAVISILEDSSSAVGDDYWHTDIVTVDLAPSSCCHYTVLQQDEASATVMRYENIQQHKDSQLNRLACTIGSKWSRQECCYQATGKGACAVFDGLTLLKGEQWANQLLMIHHNANEQSSDTGYNNVMFGKSSALLQACIDVKAKTQGVSAHLLNNNTLMTDQASATTLPVLRIATDDIVCSHGATVGALDEEALFYCRSRGMTKVQAMRLLALSVCEEVLSRCENTNIGSYLSMCVQKSMGAALKEHQAGEAND